MCPQAGFVHLGLIPGFLMLPIDVGLWCWEGLGTLLSAGLGAAVSHWEELSVVCSPTMVLPAPSAVTIWVTLLHFWGCLWRVPQV